eukprot:CAMPEP_0169373990 /NCGR_PEP_ID=MMETSP1017-20121227/37295_1 /TAXON_ID=342587 /ORGANISM="Karlodinium micrum, Strain CCMP2283" /LENGTH=54 /DNA_ID=CAMNT_0009472731 /DNA_START=421 /DNA_END=582 /DNA_ORIENTATION=+
MEAEVVQVNLRSVSECANKDVLAENYHLCVLEEVPLKRKSEATYYFCRKPIRAK